MITVSSQNNNAPVRNTAPSEAAWTLYPEGIEELPTHAASARAENLRDRPPACTNVGTIESFRNETVDFVNRLREQSLEVAFKEYAGCFHAFDMMGARHKSYLGLLPEYKRLTHSKNRD